MKQKCSKKERRVMAVAGLEEIGRWLLMGIVGLSAGTLVAGGTLALTIGLGILERFVGVSHTASQVRLYGACIGLGGFAGCLLTVFFPPVPLGRAGLAVLGLFCGVFVGGWIMALAELMKVFPVFVRRLNITKGWSLIVVSLALGKTLGSLLQFWLDIA